jgi:hypothetical protein
VGPEVAAVATVAALAAEVHAALAAVGLRMDPAARIMNSRRNVGMTSTSAKSPLQWRIAFSMMG